MLFSRRNFIKGSTILGSLAVAGGFWRGIDSGVFSTSEGPAYTAWENSLKEPKD